ncbi:MAG: VCBS repeat-containing protein [Bacteroidetes bacterium]|nr:VCBS repeat-containing protein [Bacteroidota bacterium]
MKSILQQKSSAFICLFFISIFFFIACKDYTKNILYKDVPDASIQAGEKLAKQYCASCHQFPEPSLLDAKTWDHGVLPQMGPRLGIFNYGFKQYASAIFDTNIGKRFYPSQQVISFVQWQNIIDYYTATSPDSLLPARKDVEIKMNEKLFQPIHPSFTYPMPGISFVKMEPGHQLVISDSLAKKVLVFDSALQLTDSINTNGAVTDIIKDSNTLTLCNTGVLNPNNGKFGSVENISLNHPSVTDTIQKNLMRPVQINKIDLNKDGKDDYVVCEFGNLKGALSWLENKGNNNYEYHVISTAPGAIKTYITDYNHDGLPDIWALFSQGDEGVFLYTNKGNGVFESKRLLTFPPSYGSSSFELIDFNKDGYDDIIYTCGDNADYSPVLKPYHGVYIFLNDGKNNFTQKYFYPINGCYKAIAKDFDNDGDLDIATISFFADYQHHPEEGFVFLKNNGNFNFTPYSLNAAKYGRWLTMDASDFDGDGKIDLVLGNFSIIPSKLHSKINWMQQPPFLVLKNIQ